MAPKVILAISCVAFGAAFLLPASRSNELVVLTEGRQAFASHEVTHAGYDNFLRALEELRHPSGLYALTWLGNLVPLFALWSVLRSGTRRRWPLIAGLVCAALGATCLAIPGETLLVGCYLWLAGQAGSLAAAFLVQFRSRRVPTHAEDRREVDRRGDEGRRGPQDHEAGSEVDRERRE